MKYLKSTALITIMIFLILPLQTANAGNLPHSENTGTYPAPAVRQGVSVFYYGGWSDSIQARFIASPPEFLVLNTRAGPYKCSRPNQADVAALQSAGIKVLSYISTGGMRGFMWNSSSPANDRTSVTQSIAAVAAEGDAGIYFDEGGLFSPVSGEDYQDSILDRTLASPGGISDNPKYNQAWGDSWAGYTVEDYLSCAHSLGLITCVGLDDYRPSKLNPNIFAITDFVLTAEEYTTRPEGMAPAGSEIGHTNQCWVLSSGGAYSASATRAALGYGFRAAYTCQALGSLPKPGYEYYMAAVAGLPPPADPTVSTSAASGITSTGAALNGNLGSPGSTLPVEVSFEYGLTASYGAAAPAYITSTGAFQATVGALNPGTTYHFRAKAVGINTNFGDDWTFTTAAISPGTIPPVTIASGTISPGIISPGIITNQPRWDVNGDRKCDFSDIMSIGIHWQLRGNKGWIPQDVNMDGVVDFRDMAEVILHWQQTW
jgi:hypothetical protein